MGTAYRVQVFGKAGCAKCTTLNKRLDSLLAKPDWADFGKQYCDVETEVGLVQFCRAECINPNRVPALLIQKWDAEARAYLALANPEPGVDKSPCRASRLYTFLGLQTDYSDVGKGLITPKMLSAILHEARDP